MGWRIKAFCKRCGFEEESEGEYSWKGVVAKEFVRYQKKELREKHKESGCKGRLKYELVWR
ncbi:MAG: hypothetical protein ACP5HJ_03480 [Candidatus Micrarchaeia archaeon]